MSPEGFSAVTETVPQILEFEDFRLDAGRRCLFRGGEQIALPPKAFDTLLLLVMHRGRVIDKSEVMRAVWPDTIVEENNLNQNISALRRVLGETRGENRYIATVPGRGYCFTAEVRAHRHIAEMSSEQATIAVLPFANLGGGPEREYLADGLTEETIAALGQVDPEHFSVIGRTSVMRYKLSTKTLAEIGRELGTAYLIESSLRAEGDQFRITSKLIRVADQMQIWSGSYDSEPRSLLALQRELGTTIAEQVRLRLSPRRLEALATRQTQNAEAYDLYLRGRYFWNQFTPATTRRAMEYFTRATELDANYALAWSGLTDALCSSPVTGDVPPQAVIARARETAMHAVRSDPELAESQTSLGFFNFWLGWRWTESLEAYGRALAHDASYSFAHRMLGIGLSHVGRHAEAGAAIRRARELDPLSSMHRALSSQIAFAARDLPAAVQFAREAILLDPEFWIGHFQLAQALVDLGDSGAASDALNQANRFSGGNSKALSLRGYLLARTGRESEARELLRTMDEIGRTRFMPPYAPALIHAGLGEAEAALGWLERALAAHDAHLAFLTVDPKWDFLRGEPRFARVLEACGFEQ